MKKKLTKIFYRSFWCLSTMFLAILFVILMVGEQVAMNYAGWINGFLNCETSIRVDDSANETPDVMYYKPAFSRWRWQYDENEGKYVFVQEWNKEGLYDYLRKISSDVNAEGTVLLKNENNALPLNENDMISLYGISQFSSSYITTGEGSGNHAANTTDTLVSRLVTNGVKYNQELYSAYEAAAAGKRWGTKNPNPNGDVNYVEFTVNEASLTGSLLSVSDRTTGAGQSKSAVYIISRQGSENGDTDFDAPGHVGNNYMDLTNEEIGVLDKLKEYKQAGKIESIILVLNTCNAMQFKTIDTYPIDAILWTGTGGTASYRALADVLTGKADPNGRLADTYVFDNNSAPSTVNTGDFTYAQSTGVPATEMYSHNNKYVVYQEGIYVGYKYYETRYEDMVLNRGNAVGTFGKTTSVSDWKYSEEVAYPFGYGGSYATFEHSDFDVKQNADGTFTASLTIKNTGTAYSGKDVFQLYLQKPYTQYDIENKVEKSAVELVGFEKTGLLAPGESQTVQVTVDPREFASYDAYGKGTYILETGDYYLAAGTDSHDALNNIITAKGAVNENYVDASGSADMTYVIKIDESKYDYSKSGTTGAAIVNRFDDVDPNLYANTQDQKVTYLSRSNWQGTYPAASVGLTCTNQAMVADMQYSKPVDAGDAKLPKYEQDNGLSLIDLMYEDYDSELWDKLLDQLSFSEQVDLTLLGATSVSHAASINAPGGKVQDGPAGIRPAEGSMAYPGQTVMACTWNKALIEELGAAFGMEMQYLGYQALYGPGANIHRNAYGGRNFEYYSEDAVLSGMMLTAELKGLTQMGIVTYTKHFVLNDQERNRYGVCVWANEQSIREIYLKAFQYSIEDEDCNTVGLMSSFNRLGCTWAGAHKGLLTDVLRGEWGFKGSVMTDAAVGGHMGANGNYAALANAIVAGQTIWLGDLRQSGNGYGTYRYNAAVAQAIRSACKENLYAQLNSCMMNGMKSGVRIVPITPWWQKALKGAQIGVGILTGACLAMAIASFVVVYKNKKKGEQQ